MEGNRRQFIFKSGLLLSGDDGVSEAEEEGRKEARKEDDSRAACCHGQRGQRQMSLTHFSYNGETRNESGENKSLQRLQRKKKKIEILKQLQREASGK